MFSHPRNSAYLRVWLTRKEPDKHLQANVLIRMRKTDGSSNMARKSKIKEKTLFILHRVVFFFFQTYATGQGFAISHFLLCKFTIL